MSFGVVAAVVGGLVFLFAGGEVVVRGASQLALAAGVSPLVVGLTVVAAATSAPELAASLAAAREGSPALAVGNVLGSNIGNIGVILGIAGLFGTIPVKSVILRREMPVLVAATLLVMGLGLDGTLGRLDAFALLAALVAYVGFMLAMELSSSEPEVAAEVAAAVASQGSIPFNLGLVVVGVGALVGGAALLVDGATSLAVELGVPEKVIGLTVMALGTSLPELASSLAAARKGQGDLVLGNVVGSNIFNAFGILGATALYAPIDGMAAFATDAWVALAFALFLVPLLRRGAALFPYEAALLVVAYGAYLAVLVA